MTDIRLRLDLEVDTGFTDGRAYEHGEKHAIALRLIRMAITLGATIEFEHMGETVTVEMDSSVNDIAEYFEPSRGKEI